MEEYYKTVKEKVNRVLGDIKYLNFVINKSNDQAT